MSLKPFQDKVAVVTGGGSGIGLAITELFKEQGAIVVIGQRTPSDAGYFIRTDLAIAESCAALISDTIEQFGRLDVLVNNAGVMQEFPVDELSLKSWDHHIAVNLTAPFVLSKYAIPHLRKTRGVIINIGSIEGLGANPGHAAYCASKGGLHALTRAIAVDCGSDGIRCNAVAPGWIDTDLNTAFVASMHDPENFKSKIKLIHPAGRTGKPEDVAHLVCWLASEQATFITGQTYTIDGGRTAKLSLPS